MLLHDLFVLALLCIGSKIVMGFGECKQDYAMSCKMREEILLLLDIFVLCVT
jgi:hypothetical protein